MQNFDEIEKLWSAHSVEVKISSDEMLAQAKKEVNGLKSKSLLNIFLMLLSIGAIATLWFVYDFAAMSTHAGIAITIFSALVCTVVLYRDYKLITKSDFTVHPEAFLNSLKVYQLQRFRLYTQLYWFYVFALSIGIGLYFIEILSHFSPGARWFTILLTAGWMWFCSTFVRRAVLKREKERISLLIEKFERLIVQLKD